MATFKQEVLRRKIEVFPVLDFTWPEHMQRLWWEWYGELWSEVSSLPKNKKRVINR